MAERAKRAGEAAGGETELAAAAPQAHNESLLSQGMHAISSLFGGDDKKVDEVASTPDPAAAFALLDEMKPQVLTFGDLNNPAFVNFFHRFMSAWYAANEMVTNHNFTDHNKGALKTAVFQMGATFVEVAQLSPSLREGQDAEIERLTLQLTRLATLV